MPRVPKAPAPWLGAFIEFARDKEKKQEVKKALDQFESVLDKRWDKFVTKMEDEAPPPKKRKTDPMKTLSNAVKKAASQVDEQDPAQMEQLKDSIISTLPASVQGLLQRDVSAAVSGKINELCDLAASSQNTLQDLSKTGQPEAFSLAALTMVNQMHDGLNSIKATLSDPVPPLEHESEEEEQNDDADSGE